MNWPIIIAAIIGAALLMIFFARRNWRDRKEILPPDVTDDPVSGAKRESQQRDDSI
jgi:hypothetical protein